MSIILTIAGIWVACGLIFLIASLMICREAMPEQLWACTVISLMAWPWFVYGLIIDLIKYLKTK